jgi:hypothetical protein
VADEETPRIAKSFDLFVFVGKLNPGGASSSVIGESFVKRNRGLRTKQMMTLMA